jgi:PKD-like domain/Secretion system C-terminal sorting domain
MKTFTYCAILFACFLSLDKLKAQCTVSFSGDTCINQILTAGIAPAEKIKKMEWLYNGNVIFSQPNIYSQDGLKIVSADSIGRITDIAVDDAGNVYVNDWDNKRILKFAPGATTGVEVATSLVIYIAGNRKLEIFDFCIYKDTIYMAENSDVFDNMNNKTPYYVTKWAPGATAGEIIMGPGTVNASYKNITAVTVDKNGVLYIADKIPGFNRVSKLIPGAAILDTVMGSKQSVKRTIDDLQADGAGNVYTLFRDSAEVQKWVPGALKGVLAAKGIPTPAGESFDYNRKNFLLDSASNIYLTTGLQNIYFPQVLGTQKVLMFKPGNLSGTTLLGDDGIHTGSVSGIALDKQNNLYIGDFLLKTVHKFSLAKQSNKIFTSYKPALSGNYTVNMKGQSGCTSSKTFRVDFPVQYVFINGPEFFCPGQPVKFYISATVPGAIYTWSATGGTIVSGQGTDSVTVLFNNVSSVKINISATNHCTTIPATHFRKCKQKCVSLIASSATAAGDIKVAGNNIFNINPNPSINLTTLSWQASSAGAFSITVTDLQGKLILSKTGKNIIGINTLQLNASGFSKGMYMVNLKFDKISLFQKMIRI